QINYEQVDALSEKSCGLLDQGAELRSARFIAGRYDLDHGDDVAVPVPDRNAIGFVRVEVDFTASNQTRLRRCRCHRQRNCAIAWFLGRGGQLQGQNVRDRASEPLLQESEVVWRETTGVQGVT